MKRILLFMFLTCCTVKVVFSQMFIDQTREKARKKLAQLKVHDFRLNVTIVESDSTFSYLIRDKFAQNFDLTLYFDNNNRCYKERKVWTCDTCFQQILNNFLANQYYGWTKTNDTTYYSRFSYRIILTTPKAMSSAMEVRRSDITRKEYRKIIKQKL